MRRYVVDGGTAVLTGAASGIGRATARELARRGSNLVLLDRDAEGLGSVADELRGLRPDRAVASYVVDLGDRDARLAVAREVADAHPHVHLLVNNAGIALIGRFDQVSLDDVDRVLEVNLHAVVDLTHTLLPNLLATSGSHVCNVSSLFGIIAPPGQAAYSASKFGVRGLSDALRHELADRGIGVTTVHPGGIATAIAASASVGTGVSPAEAAAGQRLAARLLHIDPAVAGRRIVDGVERRRPRVLIGTSAHLLDLAARAMPGSYGRVLAVRPPRLPGVRRRPQPSGGPTG